MHSASSFVFALGVIVHAEASIVQCGKKFV